MAAEFLRRLFPHTARSHGPSGLYGEVSRKKPIRIDSRVEELFRQAINAREHGDGDEDAAKSFSLEAASSARSIYEHIPTEGITAEGRSSRMLHALVAFSGFVDAEEPSLAKAIGRTILGDQLIPDVYKERIRKDIELMIEPT